MTVGATIHASRWGRRADRVAGYRSQMPNRPGFACAITGGCVIWCPGPSAGPHANHSGHR